MTDLPDHDIHQPLRRVRPPSVPRLILASGSPRRAELLREHGYEFDIVVPPVEEPPAPDRHPFPARWAEEISLQKAQSVADRAKTGWVLSGDTIAAIDDRIFGKPADRSAAESILRCIAGTTHRVITGVTLLDALTGERMVRHDVTMVTMRSLDDDEIAAYLDTDAWQGKAGAYGIQDRGDAFVGRIEGSFSNVVGLPMELVEAMLREFMRATPSDTGGRPNRGNAS